MSSEARPYPYPTGDARETEETQSALLWRYWFTDEAGENPFAIAAE
jgi:hypothetical protein